MEFLMGAVGALVCMAFAMGGFCAAWRLYPRLHTAAPEALTTEQRQQLKEQQEAFQTLLNYSVEDAYGMNRTQEV